MVLVRVCQRDNIQPKQHPAKQGSDGCKEKMAESHKKDSGEDEDSS